MKLKFLAVAAALAVSGTAMAKTDNLGNLNPPDSALFGNWFGSSGSFTDTYTFTIGSATNAVGGVFDFDASWGLSLDLTSVSLTGGTLSSALVDSSPLSFSFGNLGAGTYSLLVSGVVTGKPLGFWDVGGVSYVGRIETAAAQVAAPVPEPETIAMMALGLGAVGWVARRRQNAAK